MRATTIISASLKKLLDLTETGRGIVISAPLPARRGAGNLKRYPTAHAHDVCEMKIVLRGRMLCRFQNQSLKVRAGGILIIPANTLHADTGPQDLKPGTLWLNLWFVRGAFGLCLSDGREIATVFLTDEQHARLSALLGMAPADLCAHVFALVHGQAQPLRSKAAQGFLSSLFALLAQTIITTAVSPRKTEELIARAVTFMRIMYYKPRLRIDDIAQAVDRSPSYLSHIFKREKQISVWQALAGIRLNQAYRLLRQGRHSVKEAAYQTGWASPFYFSLRFKQKFGYSPSSLSGRDIALPPPKNQAAFGMNAGRDFRRGNAKRRQTAYAT
ncbi:MAG: helix-turn-helix domain-containing protein [Kiritimatiellae bacterium]|nr:helix-turn-helix domain-containing protein [Kiritimatiellia bacterium]